MLVVPAGTEHGNAGSSPDCLVVGASARARDWALCRPEDTNPAEAVRRIARVPAPERDPVTGNPWA
ncbi:hypothetical protein K7W42_08715 [Deinococcus sp. HMF7604]|uniref:hypothetical protein n=1 Tax=Deinococcus betulae TaxID=2873312 RepID=UPI001CC9F35F|nr:hypothetical protein [Deinococcus betulae]MBZ9750943.1 hypothetical protein [Deinococcus betulae]